MDMALLAALSDGTISNLSQLDNRRVLLENGQDLTQKDEQGNTPFHLVARFFNSDKDSTGIGATVLRELLGLSEVAPHHERTKRSLVDAVQKKNDAGDTILHIIASKELVGDTDTLKNRQAKTAVAEILSVCRKVLVIADRDGDTPLHRACLVGNQFMVDVLLENDRNLGTEAYHIEEIQNTAGDIPLHSAVRSSHLEAMTSLLPADRPVGTILRRNTRGETLLHVAAGQSETKVLEELLKDWTYERFVYADSNFKLQDVKGMTPLHVAVQNSTKAARGLVEQLLKGCTGSKLLNDPQPGTGWTSLHFGASGGQEQVVELLLLNGADSKQSDKDNLVAADIAREANRVDIADIIHQYRPRSFRLVLEPNEEHEKIDDHFKAWSWPKWDNDVRRRHGEPPRRWAQVSPVHQMIFKAHDTHCMFRVEDMGLPECVNRYEDLGLFEYMNQQALVRAIDLAPIHQAQIRLSSCRSKRWLMNERRKLSSLEKEECASSQYKPYNDHIFDYVYDASVFQSKKRSTRWIHFPANNVSTKITAESPRSCTDGFNVQRAWIEVCVEERRCSVNASHSNAELTISSGFVQMHVFTWIFAQRRH